MLDELFRRAEACCSVLSGTWGLVLLPFAISTLHDRRHKLLGIALVAFVGVFAFVLTHDIYVYSRNQRTWIPFYERCFGLFVPIEGGRGVRATVSFDGDKASVKVRHVQRGNHSIGIWIPDKMKDFTPVGADVELNCTFRDDNGKVVFQIHSDNAFKKLWTWCRGNRGGSKEIYCKYRVPKDVPLDEELQLEIKVTGEVDKFLRQYPNAVLSVDKYSDK
ncbi:MAG: hypothetical protein ACI4RA_10195 [Kiritimatiellia bacterium]